MLQMNLLRLVVFIAVCSSLCSTKSVSDHESGETFLEQIFFKREICFSDRNCNTDFLNLNNMCCKFRCCNYFEFVFGQTGGDPSRIWKNFYHSLKQPRTINVVISLVSLFLLGVALSIIFNFFGIFFVFRVIYVVINRGVIGF
jgi:hypothetical protein